MSDINDLSADLLGTWFSERGSSKLRFCGNGTWHETVYSGPYGRRSGLRAGLHGRFTLEGSTLTMITDSKSAMRWKDGSGIRERGAVILYTATISPINYLDEERLILGEYLRQLGDESISVASTDTYFRTRRAWTI